MFQGSSAFRPYIHIDILKYFFFFTLGTEFYYVCEAITLRTFAKRENYVHYFVASELKVPISESGWKRPYLGIRLNPSYLGMQLEKILSRNLVEKGLILHAHLRIRPYKAYKIKPSSTGFRGRAFSTGSRDSLFQLDPR